MADVAAAARTIAWIADEAWGRFDRPIGGEPDRVAPGVIRVDGEIELSASADPTTDPTLVLRVALAAARLGCRIERRTLDRLADEVAPWPPTWPAGAADKLVALLLEGHGAVRSEALTARPAHPADPGWEPCLLPPSRKPTTAHGLPSPGRRGHAGLVAVLATTYWCSVPCSQIVRAIRAPHGAV